jgi:hypothetical protein
MTEPTIQPALTAEEWAKGAPGVYGWDDGGVFIDWRDGEQQDVERPHAVAAALLHGQPFGFTRKDADVVRDAAIVCSDGAALSAWLNGLAARIEALLPPEGK